MNSTLLPVPSALTTSYSKDGYWIAHQLLSVEECDQLKIEALEVLKRQTTPGHGVLVGVAALSQLYRHLASDARLAKILAQIMPEGVMFMSDKFVIKSGAISFATPWHADASYWPNTRPKVSVWIALDDVSAENGALKVLPGSHLQDWKMGTPDLAKSSGAFTNVVSTDQWNKEDEVTCELKKGGVVFFSDRLLHGSCENSAGQDRYAIISTYHAPAADEPFDKQFPARHVVIAKT